MSLSPVLIEADLFPAAQTEFKEPPGSLKFLFIFSTNPLTATRRLRNGFNGFFLGDFLKISETGIFLPGFEPFFSWSAGSPAVAKRKESASARSCGATTCENKLSLGQLRACNCRKKEKSGNVAPKCRNSVQRTSQRFFYPFLFIWLHLLLIHLKIDHFLCKAVTFCH